MSDGMDPSSYVTPATDPAAVAEELAAIVLSSPDAVFMTTLDGTILAWNRGAERIYGLPADLALGRKFTELFPDQYPNESVGLVDEIAAGRSVENIEVQRVRADGTLIDLVVTMSPVRGADGRIDRIAAIAGDITQLKETQRELAASLDRIRQAAFIDPLTGVSSRLKLMEDLAAMPAGATDVTVVIADVDDLGFFNNAFGAAFGDAVLVEVAGIIRSILCEDELVARLGGDEFAIVTRDRGQDRGMEIVRELRRRLRDPLVIDEQPVRVSAGIGVAWVSQVVPQLSDFLMRRADLARFEAKRWGRGMVRVYDASMEADFAARTRLDERLAHALDAGRFSLVFQPICDAETGRIREVEALLRWTDPDLGAVSPVDFIPAAERTGLIVPIGEWVLREACAAVAELSATGAEMRVNVNVSPRQLAEPGFVEFVDEMLRTYELKADQLALEITESVIVESPMVVSPRLAALRDLGVGLAVDDFGTGHSSLARLHALPFSVMKVDKSLVDEIGGPAGSDVIVDAVVGMAHGLGLSVIAEGVERSDQLDRLRELDCDLIQGFLLHRPMSQAQLWDLLQVQAGAAM